jgi:hypothetical protein
MKSIIRRDTGEDWKEYLTRLMREAGLIDDDEDDPPSDDELRRFDKNRQDKKVSNEEWMCPNDADARIAKMKDGTTHAAYKAEHVVDLQSNLIVAAEIYHADQADTRTLEDSLNQAQTNLREAGSQTQIVDAVADKGYHAADTLTEIREHTPYRTYIPEAERKCERTWTDKPPEQKAAVYANRRRTTGGRGKRLQKLRSELLERSFAHVCKTGGARRTFLHAIENVRKRYLIAAAAHNLGCLMRSLFGIGTPKGLQAYADLFSSLYLAISALFSRPTRCLNASPDHAPALASLARAA